MADQQDQVDQEKEYQAELKKMPAIDRVKAPNLAVRYEEEKQTGGPAANQNKTQWIKDRLHGYKELD
jgi:hypothetical protein